MTRGEEILDWGGGRGEGEKRKEAVSLFSFHLSLFAQKRLILRLSLLVVCAPLIILFNLHELISLPKECRM